MIVLQATMWPYGNQTQSYELLNVTITNQSPPEADQQNYFAHVLARPAPFQGIAGYEADVEVAQHSYRDGFAPLLSAILGCAHQPAEGQGTGYVLPPTRQLKRVDLVDANQFEELLRKGV
jgi:hypothetical protein